MKKLFFIIVTLIAMSGFAQSKTHKKSGMASTAINVNDSTYKDRDDDIFVYKCMDKTTKQLVYVDFLEHGTITFMLNNTIVMYSVHSYVLTAKDTTWEQDSVSVFLIPTMPLESIVFNVQESKITVSTTENGFSKASELIVVDKLKGLKLWLYERKKKKSAKFVYGKTLVPPYVRFEK